MTEQRWYAGVDWASESHHVFLTDGDGRKIGEKIFKHSGEAWRRWPPGCFRQAVPAMLAKSISPSRCRTAPSWRL